MTAKCPTCGRFRKQPNPKREAVNADLKRTVTRHKWGKWIKKLFHSQVECPKRQEITRT